MNTTNIKPLYEPCAYDGIPPMRLGLGGVRFPIDDVKPVEFTDVACPYCKQVVHKDHWNFFQHSVILERKEKMVRSILEGDSRISLIAAVGRAECAIDELNRRAQALFWEKSK
jgi:hypothetical protein